MTTGKTTVEICTTPSGPDCTGCETFCLRGTAAAIRRLHAPEHNDAVRTYIGLAHESLLEAVGCPAPDCTYEERVDPFWLVIDPL